MTARAACLDRLVTALDRMLWAERLAPVPVSRTSLSTFCADQIRLERQPGDQTWR